MNTGQMLVLAGPPNVEKSFVKEFIIRPILGGRQTDPTAYLQGKTNFNKDTSRAESWEIDDQVGVSDSEKRKMLTGAIKKLTASNDHRIEGKFADAIQPPPVFHRLSIYTNDDSYDLWVLPEMNDSTRDKAIVLKVDTPENPTVKLPTIEGRPAFREQIEKALPALVYKLTQWEIPKEIADSRYGVKAYQHPELAGKLEKMSDEARLKDIINKLLFDSVDRFEPWEGTETELELCLRRAAKEGGMTKQLDKVLWHNQVLRQGLPKLEKMKESQFRRRTRKSRQRGWIINPPKERLEELDERTEEELAKAKAAGKKMTREEAKKEVTGAMQSYVR